MGAFFIIIVITFFLAVGLRLANDLNHSGWINRKFQYFRLRRRGHAFYHPSSMSLTLKLFFPKIKHRLGHHLYSEQMKYLKRLDPGHELTCEAWFCPEFHRARRAV